MRGPAVGRAGRAVGRFERDASRARAATPAARVMRLRSQEERSGEDPGRGRGAVVRFDTVRVSIRLGTSTAIGGPAVEPDIHPTIGAGVRIGRRFGVLAEVDRAKAFTLTRGGRAGTEEAASSSARGCP